MNRILLVAFAVILTLPVAGVAQTEETAIHAPTVKIGWIDIDQAVRACEEGVKIINDIQKYIDTKNGELEVIRREAEDLRTKLDVQGSKLTDEARLDLEEKARVQEVTLQRFSEDTNRDIENRRQRLYTTITSKMGSIIEKVAIDKGLDAITIFDPQRDAWVNPALNVTEDIVKAYNQAYPAGAPTIPAAAKKP